MPPKQSRSSKEHQDEEEEQQLTTGLDHLSLSVTPGLLPPPSFDGSHDATGWIDQVDEYFAVLDNPINDRQMAATARSLLSGVAASFVMTLPMETRISWDALRPELIERFSDDSCDVLVEMQLRKLSLGQPDAMRNHLAAFERVAQHAPHLPLSNLISAFADTVSGPIKAGIATTIFKSWSQLRREALRLATIEVLAAVPTVAQSKPSNASESKTPFKKRQPLVKQGNKFSNHAKKNQVNETEYSASEDECCHCKPKAKANKASSTFLFKCNGTFVDCLVDTGAKVSIMDANTAKTLSIVYAKTSEKVYGLGRNQVQVIGKAPSVSVCYNKQCTQVDFLICDLPFTKIILGNNWIEENSICICPKLHQLLFNVSNEDVKLLQLDEDDDIYHIEDDDDIINGVTPGMLNLGTLDDITVGGNKSSKSQCTDLVIKHRDAFGLSMDDLAKNRLKMPPIITDKGEAVACHPGRHSMSQLKGAWAEQEVRKYLAAGLVRLSQSRYASPVVVAPKKGEAGRFCVDYTLVNRNTSKDKFPMPRMDNQLEDVATGNVFSTLDLSKGYFQLKLHQSDIHKTAFILNGKAYEWLVMPFGLTNAPKAFARIIAPLFYNLPFVRVYADDIIVFSENEQQHLNHLEQVFAIIERNGLRLNPKKVRLMQKRITVLGHQVEAGKVQVMDEKIETLERAKMPTNKKELQRLMGSISQHRKFIPNSASILAPLSDLLRDKVPFKWTDKHKAAFNQIINALKQAPVLAPPDWSLPFILYTDASGDGIGAVLKQSRANGQEVIITCWSAKLTEAQKLYDTTEREALAIRKAVEKFYYYLDGHQFTVVTDHQPLVELFGTKSHQDRKLIRWALYLQQFNMHVIYRKGQENAFADWLSRDVLSIDVEKESRFQEPYYDDKLLLYLKERKFNGETSKRDIERITTQAAVMRIDENGIIHVSTKHGERIIPRPEDRTDIAKAAHEKGHWQDRTVLEGLKQTYWWQQMAKDLGKVSNECQACLQINSQKQLEHTAQTIAAPQNVFEVVGMDLLSGFPTSHEGYDQVLVIIDYLSKWATAYPLRSKEASEVADRIVQFIQDYGPVRKIISDNGTEFKNSQLDSILLARGIEHSYTAPGKARTNGQAENYNKTLKEVLAKYALDNPTSWTNWLGEVLVAYRMKIHPATGKTPYEMVMGQRPLVDLAMPKGYKPANTSSKEARAWNGPEDLLASIKERIEHLDRVQSGRSETIIRIGKYQAQSMAYRDSKAKIAPHVVILSSFAGTIILIQLCINAIDCVCGRFSCLSCC